MDTQPKTPPCSHHEEIISLGGKQYKLIQQDMYSINKGTCSHNNEIIELSGTKYKLQELTTTTKTTTTKRPIPTKPPMSKKI